MTLNPVNFFYEATPPRLTNPFLGEDSKNQTVAIEYALAAVHFMSSAKAGVDWLGRQVVYFQGQSMPLRHLIDSIERNTQIFQCWNATSNYLRQTNKPFIRQAAVSLMAHLINLQNEAEVCSTKRAEATYKLSPLAAIRSIFRAIAALFSGEYSIDPEKRDILHDWNKQLDCETHRPLLEELGVYHVVFPFRDSQIRTTLSSQALPPAVVLEPSAPEIS